MKKFNKKGFTLLELLIAIAIFTSIIFICYSIFNKFLMLTKDQLNINQGQLTVNDMNEYLTKDLEKTSSIALYLDNNEIAKTTQENTKSKNNEANAQQDVLKEKIDSLKEKLSVENNFEYSYKIKFKDKQTNEHIDVIYQVNITKKDKNGYKYPENNYKYSIVRKDETNGVSITFVNNETVTKKQSEEFKVPFTIEGTNPYKVSLGYNGKNNEFVRKEFTIASSIFEQTSNDEIIPPIGGDQGGDQGGNQGGNQDENFNDLGGDIVFEFTRIAEKNVNMTMEVNVGNNPKKSGVRETANNSENICAIIKTDGQEEIHATGVGDIQSKDTNFKNIKGIEIKLVGNISLSNLKVDNKDEYIQPNSSKIFYFSGPAQYRIECHVNFNELLNQQTGKFIINLIY